MWTDEHRRVASRKGLRYPSDLSDAEWALVERLIPPAKHGGRKRSVNVREVVNGIFYVPSTGCQWNALPTDLPPKSTLARLVEGLCPLYSKGERGRPVLAKAGIGLERVLRIYSLQQCAGGCAVRQPDIARLCQYRSGGGTNGTTWP